MHVIERFPQVDDLVASLKSGRYEEVAREVLKRIIKGKACYPVILRITILADREAKVSCGIVNKDGKSDQGLFPYSLS